MQDLFGKALRFHQQGNLREASVLYQQILTPSPDDPNATHYLGLVYHQQGKTKQALPLLIRSLELLPDSEQFNFHLGKVFHDIGDSDWADK